MMFVIMDEREYKRQIRDSTSSRPEAFHHREAITMAEYVIVIKEDTYEVVKNRFGDTGEFPLEFLLVEVTNKLTHRMRQRDQVSIDE
jgi:hypothetical protein